MEGLGVHPAVSAARARRQGDNAPGSGQPTAERAEPGPAGNIAVDPTKARCQTAYHSAIAWHAQAVRASHIRLPPRHDRPADPFPVFLYLAGREMKPARSDVEIGMSGIGEQNDGERQLRKAAQPPRHPD